MADLIVYRMVLRLLEILNPELRDQFERSSDVKGKLKKLEESLDHIQAVASAADVVEIEKNKHLAKWLGEIKDAAYEAEDVLDEVGYRDLEQKVAVAADDEDDGGTRDNTKVSCFVFPGKYLKRSPQSSELLLENLRRIQTRFEGLDARTGDFLNLVGRMGDGWGQLGETTSFIGGSKSEFVGREEELEQILNRLLLRDDGSHPSTSDWGVPVVPLVGLGGSGKTTLARHVFHDPRVEMHFEMKMWVHVSKNFDVKRLTREMIESCVGHKCDVENLYRLQLELKDTVGQKRFLLVLDDMWCDGDRSKTMEDWTTLFAPVADEARRRGSMILLTSRTQKVACLPGALDPIFLEGLLHDECWSIIKACAFRGDSIPDGCESLVEIGKQIAFKVQGSPFAAKAVGGMLRDNWDYGYWSKILDTRLGELPGVMEVLKASYWQLPPHLRKCFAYCSMFPTGHKFRPYSIGCMWVALGFIRPRPGETMYETGMNCFNDFLSMSFFQIERDQDSESYIMHDLVYDLAKNVSRGDCLHFEGANLSQYIPETVRHISVGSDQLDELSKQGCKFVNLRSFLLFPNYDKFDVEVLTKVLKQLRRVRVLVLDGDLVKELPDVAGDWIHLRFLHFSGTRIVRLPKSLRRLYHLQVLSVGVAWEFREEVSNLIKLRILNAQRNIAFIGRLTSLEALIGTFRVRREKGYEIGQLKGLNELRGSLVIRGLENVGNGQEAKAANLRNKRWLAHLTLGWDYATTARSPDVEDEVLEALQPPSDLKVLSIDNYGGSTCPSWMCNQWLSKLNSIYLDSLTKLVRFPPLGQLPFLEALHMYGLLAVRELTGYEFYGVQRFPSLKKLVILNMPELEQWSAPDGGQWFSRLQELEIRNCPNLRSLPPLDELPSLRVLYMEGLHAVKEIGQLGYQVYWSGGSAGRARWFPSLEKIHIQDMLSLEWWPFVDEDQWRTLPRLCEFSIKKCPKLRRVPSLSPTLTRLEIRDCEQLASLPHKGFRELSSLETLAMSNCPQLTWPTQNQEADGGSSPSSLKYLGVEACGALGDEALYGCLQDLCNLHGLRIGGCPCLTSLPPAMLLSRLWNLQVLIIVDCEALTTAGLAGIQALRSLKELAIKGCPGLLSSPTTADVAGRTFSSPLARLQIDNLLLLTTVPILKTVSSLQELSITGAFQGTSFPSEVEELLLQNCTNFRKIELFWTPSLKFLPAGLQYLSSLKCLLLYHAPELHSLPDLPNSLEKLLIYHSHTELKRRHQKDVGPDWHKIQHIKEIELVDDDGGKELLDTYHLTDHHGFLI